MALHFGQDEVTGAIENTGDGDNAVAGDTFAEDGVDVHPGQFFGFEGEAFLVLSLLTPAVTFTEGARRLIRRVG